MSDELRPCPFCGGEAEHFGGGGNHCVRCTVCEVTNETLKRESMVFGAYITAEDAVAAWNARAAVTDGQFAMAVHDGEVWQRVRECRMSHARGGGWYCSECGVWVAPGPMANATEHLAPRYCPNCGAKVVG